MKNNQHIYSIPCSKDRLKEVRLFVEGVLSEFYNLDQVQVNSMVLAVDEVCANLMIHSHGCNPQETIEIRITSDQTKGIMFEITDKGDAFDITAYDEPTLNQIIKERKKGGMGLMLVKRIMDEIEFQRDKNNKNICRLSKKIKRNNHR